MNKLIVKFQGGLGNQLYDYAFAEWLKTEYTECEVLADISYYKIRMAHDDLGIWKIFPNFDIPIASNVDVFKYSGQIPIIYGKKGADRLNAIRKRINNRCFYKRVYTYVNEKSNPSVMDVEQAIKDGKKFFEGYWQNVEFIQDQLPTLRKKLQFPEAYNNYISNEMLQDNSVSLHVRRGDYVGSYYEQEVNESYYKKAIQLVKEREENPHFFIFSDDKEYVGKAFDWLDNKTIVTGYDNKLAHVDMFLMSRMKNNIIANSTFSLWAAYLNENENPLIVFPNVKSMDKKTLSGWVGVK